jgi:hypothetical protein
MGSRRRRRRRRRSQFVFLPFIILAMDLARQPTHLDSKYRKQTED